MKEQSPLRRLQLAELEVLDEVVAICEACGFRYYMLGGTLLGAVRNQGFIPWDDDIDIALPRPDYEAFKIIARKHLKQPYQLYCYEDNNDCRYSWARVINPSASETIRSANKERVEDAWVDLIPLDGMPDDAPSLVLHKARLSFWWNLNQILQFDELVDQHRERGPIGATLVKLAGCFKWLGKVIDYRTCLAKINSSLQLYPYDSPDNNYAFNYLAAFGFKELFPKKCFEIDKSYLFEGREVKGPSDYDTVLTTIYDSSYLTPPPEASRNKHNGVVS